MNDDVSRVDRVDPFIGTGGTGHTSPGAKLPFGMIYLAPMNQAPSAKWDYCAGYQRQDGSFWGIAHTAVSGAGIRLGMDLAVSPIREIGRLEAEAASPGYYSATVMEDIAIIEARERTYRAYEERCVCLA